MVTTALLKTMTKAEIQAEIDKFNTANENESFSPESISIVLGVSMAWLQKKRCEGGGGSLFQNYTTGKSYIENMTYSTT